MELMDSSKQVRWSKVVKKQKQQTNNKQEN